ncbi:MAG TPA: UTP--glucose-1-phosphate uridylyltransferase [Candidatus Limnocylindria bacterium]|nr:UTP--glucose-1-phosphate uridylyltransferase [Candidatus Limnocylindria bacterium]
MRTAVIPAGGLGTRFLPFSRSVPKELLPLVDTPVLDAVVSECADSGIERVIIVTAPGKESLAAYFQPSPRVEARLRSEGRAAELEALTRPQRLARVEVVVQPEPNGNGHAVLVAREAVGDEPFAMLWGDDLVFGRTPALRQMLDLRERLGGSIAGAARVPREQASRYGVFAGQPERGAFRVTGMVEKPAPAAAPSDLVSIHGYVLEPAVFGILEAQRPGRAGEIWLVDAVNVLASREPVWAVELDGERYDAGDRAGYVSAFVDRALARDDVGPALRDHLRSRGWRSPGSSGS